MWSFNKKENDLYLDKDYEENEYGHEDLDWDW
jgi:hypothetical protein